MTDPGKRFSPMKFTKSQIQRGNGYSPKNRGAPVRNYQKYYCHHLNAIYMGGVDSFNKNGSGVILMDDGTCILSSYSQNRVFGHNIVFHNQSLTSIIVDGQSNRDVCFRHKEYVLRFKMKRNQLVQGTGYLIDFERKRIFQLKFHRSSVIKKTRILDEKIEDRIFNKLQYDCVLGITHANAMTLKIIQHPDISIVEEGNNNYIIGYVDKTSQQINGVAFKASINTVPNKFDVHILEKGYYTNSVPDKFGQINFENGNYYYGQLSKGHFHGRGVLVHPEDKQWTYGTYYQNQLIEVLDSSVTQPNTQSSPSNKIFPKKKKQTLGSILRHLHQFDKAYIKANISMAPHHNFSFAALSKSIEENNFNHAERVDDFKSNGCKKILEDFVSGQYAQETKEAIREVLKESKNSKVEPNEQQEENYVYVQTSPQAYKKNHNLLQDQQNLNQNADIKDNTKSPQIPISPPHTDQNDDKETTDYRNRQNAIRYSPTHYSPPHYSPSHLRRVTYYHHSPSKYYEPILARSPIRTSYIDDQLYYQRELIQQLDRQTHLSSRWRQYLQIRDKLNLMQTNSLSRSQRKLNRLNESRYAYSPIRKI